MKTLEITTELAKRLLKGNAYKGASATQLLDAWNAMEELEAILSLAQSAPTIQPRPVQAP